MIAVVGAIIFVIAGALVIRYVLLKRRHKLTEEETKNEVYHVTHTATKNVLGKYYVALNKLRVVCVLY